MTYLDHAATSPILPEILSHYTKMSKIHFANPSSSHQAGKSAQYILEEARNILANLLDVNPKGIYFTSGATESANFLIKGFAKITSNKKNQIIISAIEHSAVSQTALDLQKEGWEVRSAIVNEHGLIKLPELLDMINENTSIISIMCVNNEIGTIQNINGIAEAVKNKNKELLFVSDIVQAFGKIPLSLNFDYIDAIFASGHKFGAPKGCGFFYLNPNVKLSPMFLGGGQERGLRSGTTDAISASCIGKAAIIAFVDLEKNYVKLQNIDNFLKNQLDTFKINYQCIVPLSLRSPYIFSIIIHEIPAHLLVDALSSQGCYISSSSACNSLSRKKSHVIEAIALPCDQATCVIRVSFSQKTTKQEIIHLVKNIKDFIEVYHAKR